jgi:SAM-dependent methyltransferase
MFFAEKIRSIGPRDRVLEIGPGATPHPRSNAFLELEYRNDADKVAQRGGVLAEGHFGERPIHYYDGGTFPFRDGEFDYVICSHVIEHVPEPSIFLGEVFRVSGGRGYLEYPMITAEYLYDFDVHLNFIKYSKDLNILWFLPKKDTHFAEFSPLTTFFRRTLTVGWDDVCGKNPHLYFEGFEFNQAFEVRKTSLLTHFVIDLKYIAPKARIHKALDKLISKIWMR